MSEKALLEALKWIAQRANDAYEQDTKLRSRGARTLKRIAERAETALREHKEQTQ